MGEKLRGFLPLLLVDCISSGRSDRCTMSSWRRSCCPGCASCCGGLEVRKCGRDKQKDEMADQMTDYFHSQNDDAAILSR